MSLPVGTEPAGNDTRLRLVREDRAISILIVGAGIGGLAAAAALLMEGLDVRLVERSPTLGEVGAGLVVPPNALKVLDYLGAGGAIRRDGVPSLDGYSLDYETGNLIHRNVFSEPGQAPGRYLMHRADLYAALKALVPAGSIFTGSTVTGVEQDRSKATIRLDDGEVLQADIVIGADGIRSAVRASLFGDGSPNFTGIVGWRAIIQRAKAPHIPLRQGSNTFLGPGRYCGYYPIRRSELINFYAWVPADEVHRESWTNDGDLRDLHASLRGVCAQMRDALEAVESSFMTPLYVRDPLSSWVQGRVALLGDAAHPATTAIGQGAAMAIEDAVTLAICLGRHRDDLPSGLLDYDRRRVPRTARMQSLSMSGLRFNTEADPLQRNARNGRFKGLQRLDPKGLTGEGAIAGYDPVAAAKGPYAPPPPPPENPLRRPAARNAFDLLRSAIGPEDRAGFWRGERDAYDKLLRRLGGSDMSSVRKVAEIDAFAVGNPEGPVILYGHGGAYTMGSASSSMAVAARLAEAVNGWALVPEYRLAPEYPFPAAADDMFAAYEWLLDTGKASERILFAGDCAGAGLVLGAAIAARDAGLPLPAAIGLTSPFLDLGLTARSIESAGATDPLFNRAALTQYAASYIQQADPLDPRVSPLLASLAGLPPLFVQASSGASLRDDAGRLAETAMRAGVPVELLIEDDSVPSMLLFEGLPESGWIGEKLANVVVNGRFAASNLHR